MNHTDTNQSVNQTIYFFFRAPVSLFSGDSIYEMAAPQVDSETQNIFHTHVHTGQGLIKTMCREDIVIYRKYVKNRYM